MLSSRSWQCYWGHRETDKSQWSRECSSQDRNPVETNGFLWENGAITPSEKPKRAARTEGSIPGGTHKLSMAILG